jgi:hypothetical protein
MSHKNLPTFLVAKPLCQGANCRKIFLYSIGAYCPYNAGMLDHVEVHAKQVIRQGCGELAEFSTRGMYKKLWQELVRSRCAPNGSGQGCLVESEASESTPEAERRPVVLAPSSLRAGKTFAGRRG